MRSTFKTALLACAALAIAPAAQAQLLSPQWPSEQRARFLALGKAQWSLDQTCNTMIAFTRTLEADAFFANFNGVPARVAMANDFAAWRQDDARGLGAKHPSSVFNWSICEGNPAATAMFALLPVAISAPAPLPAPAPAAAQTAQSPSFQQGLADRQTWEIWIAQQIGDADLGASWWSGQRSLPHPGDCKSLIAPAQISACDAAKAMLDPFDAKRKTDRDYKSGWNSYVPASMTLTQSATPTPAEYAAPPQPMTPPAPKQQVLVGEQTPGTPSGQTMQFRLVINNDQYGTWQWVSAQGPITKQTPNDFLAFMQQYHDKLYIHPFIVLDSPGGSLTAGLELGKLFRAATAQTGVAAAVAVSNGALTQGTGLCASACAYAFLGGSVRVMVKDSKLGFHQFYFTPPKGEGTTTTLADGVSEAQTMTGALVLYLKTMGIDPAVLALASDATPSNLYMPDQETMTRLKITS